MVDKVSAPHTGTVKRIQIARGFCFILSDQDRKDYFCHASAVEGCALDDLAEGDRVQFQAGQGPKGPRADGVVRIARKEHTNAAGSAR